MYRDIAYLLERTGEIMVGESILLEEFTLNDISNLESELLILGKGILTHQLDDFIQLHLLMEDLLNPLSQHGKLLVEVVEETI